MKKLLVSLPLLLLLAACGSAPDDDTSSPSPSATPSAVPSATPSTPAFTDVSRGDTDSIVRLLQFTPGRNQAVVVEPVIFMTNPEFCETFRIPADDKRCTYAWSTAGSEAKITLPRADDAIFALVDQSDLSACMDDMGAGSCEVPATDFADHVGEGPTLIRLTTDDGVAVRLAELYVP
ncbi:hypothetical protein J2S43_004493 [Catenuloplanes nepalensis]|uniref:Uncharacterized protein n=1 Tax=Catenuloplanes nepalensis TaxID=587533 RepID=A0ABT9MY74_9ACTN|nr:hypothetical protein [Catenuloplanes nepalensis]MDP9795981.1 hypothetical protein [Catenuloplanes nepalensis]